MPETRRDYANAIRALAMDAVQCAHSGHPGMPMGMADIAEVLWRDFLQHNPKNPHWANRDRFILSNGHGSMLLYALLYLTGYDLSLDDLKNFRQLKSKTPGHPEYNHTPGVETTTGPLGQGLANGVGMALAEKILAAYFNRDNHSIVDHFTYVFCGDGCLMEGISHEVCSLAGTWQLGKLIVFWDNNGISIDGNVTPWFSDNTPRRFQAYNWHVMTDVDGHDTEQIKQAITQARDHLNQPTLICCKTQIGFGSPNKSNTAKAHGAPLGEQEIALTRQQLGWPYPPFEIPKELLRAFNAEQKGRKAENLWNQQLAAYKTTYPQLASEFLRRQQGLLPKHFEHTMQTLVKKQLTAKKNQATRKTSGQIIQELITYLPELLGGSSDLSDSNSTMCSEHVTLSTKQPKANYIHYGVREFGMSAIMNGIALHKGLIPFGGTFLVFSDYARHAIRLSAMMKQRVIYIYSHDSIGLGEDGPTHQPIEQLSSLRLIPQLTLWRPADHVETAIAWEMALKTQGASCLLLTRQNVKNQVHDSTLLESIQRGGYILRDAPQAKGIFIATGSELELATKAACILSKKGYPWRVVSMPCIEQFLKQDPNYQQSVLPDNLPLRIIIEAGASGLWYRFVGAGSIIGIDRFGFSAPYAHVYEALGLTVDNIVKTAQNHQKTKKS